tara:strand:+ start:6146 stop:7378 length:1233 start_codon:yes stop_codon:yes gene_type:complete
VKNLLKEETHTQLLDYQAVSRYHRRTGIIARDEGDLVGAAAHYKSGADARPPNGINSEADDCQVLLGLCQLSMGNFTNGWDNYEARRFSAVGGHSPLAIGGGPRWKGQPLEDAETIFITPEQGIGDQLLYLSPFAHNQEFFTTAGGQWIIEVDPKIEPLIRANLPMSVTVRASTITSDLSGGPMIHDLINLSDGPTLHTLNQRAELFQACTYQASVVDLCRSYNASLTLPLPGSSPWSHTSYETTETATALNSYLNNVSLKPLTVGFSWKGHRGGNPRKRARMEDLLPLMKEFKNRGYTLYALHPMDRPEVDAIDIKVYECVPGDVSQLHSLVSRLSHVITTPSTTAHVAAGSDTRTTVLCSTGSSAPWYWRMDGNQPSRWYPNTEVVLGDSEYENIEWAKPAVNSLINK